MWNTKEIIEILIEAGNIALHYYQNPSCSVKRDGSIVTNADCEIENLFAQLLDKPEVGKFLIGEETIQYKSNDYIQNSFKNSMFVVDPIDGTVSYANHLPNWGISIGYSENANLIEGAIYLPVTREIFISDGNNVYFINVKDNAKNHEFLILKEYTRESSSTGLIAITQDMSKKGKFHVENPVHTICCAVMPLAYLLVDRYHAYIANLKLWDLAGGLPMLQKLNIVGRFVGSRRVLDTQINSKNYFLDSDHSQRWKIRDHVIFASSKIADNFFQYIELP